MAVKLIRYLKSLTLTIFYFLVPSVKWWPAYKSINSRIDVFFFVSQENQLDKISEIVTPNDQIQTIQIDNIFQLEIATIHSPSGQQQQSPIANVTQGNVAMPGIL